MKTIRRGSRGDDVRRLQRALHLIDDGIFGPVTEEVVKAHQRKYGLVADGVVGPSTWATLEGGEALKLKTRRTIKEIIVHCSATREGQHVTVSQIRQWHRQRNFADIGYHYVVYLDGSVHAGRPLDNVGAHCTGHNTHSIGVCYVGGLASDGRTAKDTRTAAQKSALRKLLKDLKKEYPRATIHGHYEFANKACPCFKPKEEYRDL